ncbi:hypothetical protein F441_19411 [Phytophthora nicotianae CJ01A1]|uniref:Uncharacterized protein n=2 Tax=Phytophthora nicotianae TaxID=4792 RepID=W2W0Z2_PHYNI|nr:hypothetical protein L916_18906 [Phytophthora nicotianae]ETP03648.1 hypothetical protein F441_19411 [Phytophthora nicotianae CJ01A1]
MNTKPHEILASLAANNVPMSEQVLLEWLNYLARFVEQIVLACVLPASVLGSSGY